MSERRVNSMYVFEGSAVRKLDTAPYREQKPKKKPQNDTGRVRKEEPRKQVSAKVDKALAFDLKYTICVVASVFIMVAACVAMLYMESKIDAQENNISQLETQLETMEVDNAAYKMSIDNMYSMEELYDAAVNELGMVYAKKGQIVYYESADEDYVKQYQDVPEAN